MTSLLARETWTAWADPTIAAELFKGFAPVTFMEGTKVLFAASHWETDTAGARGLSSWATAWSNYRTVTHHEGPYAPREEHLDEKG